ncbi:MAG: glycosyltransferase [Candidatus Cloacimonetes bacterium]|jgi:GT2 family glycosyltransferase|nr:glycosyltransferase [Candidatus Cloacimonadota bacterium]
MPEYLNPHPHDLYLVGPDGNTIHVRKGRRVRLPEFFDRYVNKSGTGAKGYLVNVEHTRVASPPKQEVKAVRSIAKQLSRPVRLVNQEPKDAKKRTIVGHVRKNISQALSKSFTNSAYSISNNIGVGILTYNRPGSLRRLINSIIKYTDLCHTTIFISDDGSTNQEQLQYLSELEQRGDIVILKNQQQLGVAGNSNRLMRCLSRFPKKILLNDDVEILNLGWDNFYFLAMQRSGSHHFCYRQPGVYGAEKGDGITINGVAMSIVNDKPQGAVMAFDHDAFSKVGYFDEQFGQYGVEHVDWSTRLSNSQLQHTGFLDVDGSESYFLVHRESSSVENRVDKLKHARTVLNAIGARPVYIDATDISIVPSISCVIPFREIGRKDSIFTVLGNIRAQRFPNIEIVMTEEDATQKIKDREFVPAKYVFTAGTSGAAFNKSRAWNFGVASCTSDMLVLHDADTLIPSNYFQSVAKELNEYDACHLCKQIFYVGVADTNNINTSGTVDHPSYDYMVDYFEGGSIACRRKSYWKIGGFSEEFVGYGVEDNDFYFRLSKGTNYHDNRIFDLLHLNHGRVDGWGIYHKKNKELGAKLSSLSIGDRIARQRQLLTRSGRGHLLD